MLNTDSAQQPQKETVKLISSDGFEFIIDRKCAMGSGTIKNMLSGPGVFYISFSFCFAST
ncbi:hypothetical protein BKA69DRAFT_1052380 [Paraphysoderma sedebokerense]|nr:hypothetical protein BKA69DRAFT_1052380 [Paraphysoderma sedebokerense]